MIWNEFFRFLKNRPWKNPKYSLHVKTLKQDQIFLFFNSWTTNQLHYKFIWAQRGLRRADLWVPSGVPLRARRSVGHQLQDVLPQSLSHRFSELHSAMGLWISYSQTQKARCLIQNKGAMIGVSIPRFTGNSAGTLDSHTCVFCKQSEMHRCS